MSEPKTTIDLPFSPEDVRMGRHLGNAIAGYRDGDFKRSAEGMVEAVRAFQAAADERDRLRAEVETWKDRAIRGRDLVAALMEAAEFVKSMQKLCCCQSYRADAGRIHARLARAEPDLPKEPKETEG